jgi:hypothetical protein
LLGRSIITLKLGTRVLTSRVVAADRQLPSQGIYRVSTDGQRLAWLDGAVLHLLEATGREQQFGNRVRMFRLSPDGAALAYVDGGDMVLADLAAGTRRSLGSISAAYFLGIEWIEGGPIVVARTHEGPRTITYFPVAAPPRLIARQPEHIERAVGTPSSTRVVWFTGRGVFSADAKAGEVRQLSAAPINGFITGEMAPDGSSAAWSENYAMKRIELATGKVTRINALSATSLWYGDDGALAYSWYDNAFYRQGEEVKRLFTHANYEAHIGGVRFRHGAAGLLVVEKSEAVAWNPADGSITRVVSLDGLVDADEFAGGVVTLVSRPDQKDPPRPSAH